MMYLLIFINLFMADPAENYCSCLPPEEITSAEVDGYDVILTGRIEGAREEEGKVVYAVNVSKFYKGWIDKNTVEIVSYSGPELCGIGFVPGDKWLIFANKRGGYYFTDSCSRSKRMGPGEKYEVREDLKFLIKRKISQQRCRSGAN